MSGLFQMFSWIENVFERSIEFKNLKSIYPLIKQQCNWNVTSLYDVCYLRIARSVFGSDPLSSLSTILWLSYFISPLKSPWCQGNPCPPGMWPWQTEDGYQRCLLASEDEVDECAGQIVEMEGKLQCNIFEQRFTNLGRKKCQRGRLFRRGRCVPRFLG